MAVYELITAAIDNALKGNICTPFEACGLAEFMFKDGQTFPVTMDFFRKRLVPTELSRLLIYHRFDGPEERGDVDDNSFGLNVNQEFNRDMVMVGVGLSVIIHKSCSTNDYNLAQGVADQFPTEASPTTTVNNVQIQINSIEVDKDIISSAEWDGIDLKSRFPKLSFFKISYSISGTYCKDSCGGDTVNICADVQVTDTDLAVYNVPSGGSFTCTNPNTQNPNSVIWANFEDSAENANWAKFNDHVLQKDYTGNAAYDAGATSNQTVTATKFTLETTDSIESVVIGISQGDPVNPVPAAAFGRVDHGFWMDNASRGRLLVLEGGASPFIVVASDLRDIRLDTVCEVRFSAGKIQYYYNGVLVYTSLTAYPVGTDFYTDAVLYQPGTKLTTVEWVV